MACTQDDGLVGKLKKEEMKVLKDGSSFVHSVPIILKAPMVEAVAQAQMMKGLLSGHIKGLPSFSDALQALQEQLHGPLGSTGAETRKFRVSTPHSVRSARLFVQSTELGAAVCLWRVLPLHALRAESGVENPNLGASALEGL